MGHSQIVQLDNTYLDPTKEKLFSEYLKVLPMLLVDEKYKFELDSLKKQQKIDELENAKILASEDAPSKRGYSKRLRKMYERLDHLKYISSLAGVCEETVEDEVNDAVDAFRRRVEDIAQQPPGQLL